MKAQLHIFLTAVLNGTISFMSQGFTLGTHLIGDWVNLRAGKEEKSLVSAENYALDFQLAISCLVTGQP